MFGLSYREVWALDFEFISEPGALPVPVCMVARELTSGRLVRLWQDELPARPPFPVDASTLFVAYYASAEIGCFLELGWPVPARIIDLYAEFRNRTNGLTLPAGKGLLGALSYFELGSISKEQKADTRALVLRGGPWSSAERREILDYCQSDVDCLGPLLERMAPAILARPAGLGQALLRGRYTAAAARMERAGIPVDVPLLDRIRDSWEEIKLDLVRVVDKDFGVFDGTSFKEGLFASWLADRRIAWPRHDTGRLQLDGDTFSDMTKRFPQIRPLKELRHALGELRLSDLAVGPDGRNRVMLSAFATKTGRNAPSNSKFIFGPAVWMRQLIRPPRGHALAYIDWSSQEMWIAAALSGDPHLRDAVTSGDPYLAFAKLAGLAPPDATRETHEQIRAMCKIAALGTTYGMQARTLAVQAAISEIEAQNLLRRLAQTYPVYTEWARHVSDIGLLGGRMSTVLGWDYHAGPAARVTTLRNWPMQSNGAEMMRLACCSVTEAGVTVCAPVHDALLIEGPADDIDQIAAFTAGEMRAASAVVLDGYEIPADVKIIRWPERYADPRGAVMWSRVNELLPHVSQDRRDCDDRPHVSAGQDS